MAAVFIESEPFVAPPPAKQTFDDYANPPTFIESEPFVPARPATQTFDDYDDKAIFIESEPFAQHQAPFSPAKLDPTATYIQSDAFVPASVKVTQAEAKVDAPVFIQSDSFTPTIRQATAVDESQDAAIFVESEPFNPAPVAPAQNADHNTDAPIFIESDVFTPSADDKADVAATPKDKVVFKPAVKESRAEVPSNVRSASPAAPEEEEAEATEKGSVLDWLVPLGLASSIIAAGFFAYRLSTAQPDEKGK